MVPEGSYGTDVRSVSCRVVTARRLCSPLLGLVGRGLDEVVMYSLWQSVLPLSLTYLPGLPLAVVPLRWLCFRCHHTVVRFLCGICSADVRIAAY